MILAFNRNGKLALVIDFYKFVAILKRRTPDARHAASDGYARKIVAIFKCIVAYTRYAVRNEHAFYPFTSIKRICPEACNRQAVVGGGDYNVGIRVCARASQRVVRSVIRHGVFQPCAYILIAANGANAVFEGMFAVRLLILVVRADLVPVVGVAERPLLFNCVRFNGNGSYAVLGIVPRIAFG